MSIDQTTGRPVLTKLADEQFELFREIRDAIKDGGANRRDFVPIGEDFAILRVLADAKTPLFSYQIRQMVAALRVRMGTGAFKDAGYVTVSQDKILERLKLLQEAGFTARPIGPDGRLTQKKGTSITTSGRELLKKAVGLPSV